MFRCVAPVLRVLILFMLYLKDGLNREEELVWANLLLVSDAVEIAPHSPGFVRSIVQSDKK